MRKSTRIVKRILALFLVVLMSIENFAAVVGDNDGAAFITKAEFDSLKNNFQSQIDQYNTSIDSKIDGAIASYLAGIKIGKQGTLTNNKSKLVYPLYMYMQNESFNVSTWDKQGQKPYIGADWIWHFVMRRNYEMRGLKGRASSQYGECSWAYDVETQQSKGYSIITGISSDVQPTVNISGTASDTTAQYGENIGIALGMTVNTTTTNVHQHKGTGNNTFENIIPTGNLFYTFDGRTIDESSFGFTVWHFWNWTGGTLGLRTNGTSRDDYLNQWYSVSGVNENWNEGPGMGDQQMTLSLSHKIGSFNKIYNDTGTNLQVPVIADGSFFMVNNQGMKANRISGSIWSIPGSAGDVIFSFKHQIFLDNGLTPEPQNSGSSREWYQKSLQYPASLMYEFIGANNNETKLTKLNEGVPLTQWNDMEVTEGILNIDIHKEWSGLEPYLVMSTDTIPLADWGLVNDNTDTWLFYLEKDKKPTSTSHRLIKLEEGKNKIYFAKDIKNGELDFPKKDDYIFYKILWIDPGDQWVSQNARYCCVNSEPTVDVTYN